MTTELAVGRCTYVKMNGSRCKQDVTGGDELCKWHKGHAVKRLALTELASNSPDIPIEEHLLYELRLSYSLVKHLELTCAELGFGNDMWRHRAVKKETRTGGPGGGYDSTTTETTLQPHPALNSLFQAMKTHDRWVGLCVQAGIAAKQIAAVERFAEVLMMTTQQLVEALGHDPSDPATRAVIASVMAKQVGVFETVTPPQLTDGHEVS